jgi:hypothetical protein
VYGILGGKLEHTIIASSKNWGGLSPYGEPSGGSSAFFSMVSSFSLVQDILFGFEEQSYRNHKLTYVLCCSIEGA